MGDRIPYSNYGKGLSLMGPAELIAARSMGEDRYSQCFDWEQKFNGTSSATPNVAGVASLVWSMCPELSAVEVRKIMADTAYDLGDKGYNLETGHGFVDADAAVRRAMAMAVAKSSSTVIPWEVMDDTQQPPSILQNLRSKKVLTSHKLWLVLAGLKTLADWSIG